MEKKLYEHNIMIIVGDDIKNSSHIINNEIKNGWELEGAYNGQYYFRRLKEIIQI